MFPAQAQAFLLGHIHATSTGSRAGVSSPPVVLPQRWVVDCKRLDHGGAAVVYLGRYLYRGVIQDRDILRCDDTGVTYRWCQSKTGKMQQRSVSGAEFLRLVLQPAQRTPTASHQGLLSPDRTAPAWRTARDNCRGGPNISSTTGLVQQTDQIAASRDQSLIVRPQFG